MLQVIYYFLLRSKLNHGVFNFFQCFPTIVSTALALVFPPVIQLISTWGTSDGPGAFVLVKNSIILSIALLGFSTGTYESVVALVHAFFY